MTWSEIDFHPGDRKLRLFAILFFAASTLLGTWQGLEYGRLLPCAALLIAGCTVALLGFYRPSPVRFIYLGMTIASFPLGWLVSHMLLALVYFGLFAPVALLFRLIGRDVLDLRANAVRESYLKTRPAARSGSSYFRPY
jgi:Saxitoxin biosynthesis operon protein SxtJ